MDGPFAFIANLLGNQSGNGGPSFGSLSPMSINPASYNPQGGPWAGAPAGAALGGVPAQQPAQSQQGPGLLSGLKNFSPNQAELKQALGLLQQPKIQPTQWAQWMPMGGR